MEQSIIKSANNLIWIDLEMTGLDPLNDRIIEIATVVTDAELNVLAEGPSIAIYQPDSLLDKMDEWNTRQHTKSGLVDRVKNSTFDEKTAELQTLEFLRQYVPKGKSPMCGNTICQDRRFLHQYMLELVTYFHYRNLDVSTLKILAKHWAPKVFKQFKSTNEHLALADVYASINELRYYRENFIQESFRHSTLPEEGSN